MARVTITVNIMLAYCIQNGKYLLVVTRMLEVMKLVAPAIILSIIANYFHKLVILMMLGNRLKKSK